MLIRKLFRTAWSYRAQFFSMIIMVTIGVGIFLAGEFELSLTLGVLTYSVSILVTFGVSLVVGWMVARKNKHIDMVEALKGRE